MSIMSIRVGSIKFPGRIYPSYPGYELIEVMTPSSKYGSLGPYALRDSQNRIIENVYQFSKIYKGIIPSVDIPYSRFSDQRWQFREHRQVIDAEALLKGEILENLTDDYWDWRYLGSHTSFAVRYPVGMVKRGTKTSSPPCLCALSDSGDLCNYIEARTKIYIPLYLEAVTQCPQFEVLKRKYDRGDSLLIAEVNGPTESLKEYYKSTYGIEIEGQSVEATPEILKAMLYDTKCPFGHGYVLAMALMDLSVNDL